MKLQCEVEVIDRSCNSFDTRPMGKYLESTLALLMKPKSEKECFIIHFSGVNKIRTKYNIIFLEKVIRNCTNKKKVTLRFNEPKYDLRIKSEVIHLTKFVRLLKSRVTLVAKDLDLKVIGITHEEFAPTELVVDEFSKLIKGLPRTLESLHITGLNLRNLRCDGLLFSKLAIVDLSNNQIRKIPAEFETLDNIRELHLAQNCLGVEDFIDWRWLLGKNINRKLQVLDLSGNYLKELPKNIWKLQYLESLKVDNNKLEALPSNLGRIKSLRYLSVSNNELQFLPSSLIQCRLKCVDITSNEFIEFGDGRNEFDTISWDFNANSLYQMSAEAILNNKIMYESIIPSALMDFLENANMCVCGRAVFNESYFSVKLLAFEHFSEMIICSNNNTLGAKFQFFFCSPKCFAGDRCMQY